MAHSLSIAHVEGKVKGLGCLSFWWQKYEVAGHFVSTVKNQREINAGAQLAFSVSWQRVYRDLPLPVLRWWILSSQTKSQNNSFFP